MLVACQQCDGCRDLPFPAGPIQPYADLQSKTNIMYLTARGTLQHISHSRRRDPLVSFPAATRDWPAGNITTSHGLSSRQQRALAK